MKKITVILTLDDRGGIGFDGKRQSRDRELIKDICLCSHGKIYMSEYSAKLFGEYGVKIEVVDDPVKKCPDGCTAFIECQNIAPYIEYIEKIVIYKWNKIYPAELFFDLSDMLVAEKMTEQREFVGFSHEKITKEVYEI